jgi:hypothetical protein
VGNATASEIARAEGPPRLLRIAARGLVVAGLLNVLFLLLLVATNGSPETIRARTLAAFQSGDLDTRDFPPFDSRHGFLQYSDCIVLQMLSVPDSSRLRRAISPLLYVADSDWRGQCAVLRRVTADDAGRRGLLERRYSRYWHGYNVPVALGLRAMEIGTLRRVLVAGVWIALATFTLLMWRIGAASRLVALAIAVAAGLFWAVPYFAPSFTSGFGDAALLLGIAVLAWRRSLAARVPMLIGYAAGFGAVIVYFEMLTGQLPVAAAWLLACVVAVRHDGTHASPTDGQSAGTDVRALAAAALAAFAAGALFTVAIKQLLAYSLYDPRAGDAFFSHLGAYANVPDGSAGRPGLLLPFVRLWQRADVLTYGSQRAGEALLALVAATWIAGAARAWRDRGVKGNADRVVLLVAALLPVFWVLVLPRHTFIHAVFMVRILVASVALAPLAAAWPLERGMPTGGGEPIKLSLKH